MDNIINSAVESLAIGSVVCSAAGRDSGKYFVVMWAEENFVGLCDGDLRKTDGVKKKKIKHIVPTGYISEYVASKLKSGEKATNSEIRREIAEYLDSREAE